MREILCMLFALRAVAGSTIITKDNLYSSNGIILEPVPLQTKSPEPVNQVTGRSAKIRETPKELLRSLGYVRTENESEGRDFKDSDEDYEPVTDESEEEEYYLDTTPAPTTTSIPEYVTKKIKIMKTEDVFPSGVGQSQNRTKLYPVGRLWERTMPPRPMPGIMAVLDAAFSCIWSGLGFECFSLKVVPMFRAMMGFPPMHPFGHPYYVLPRTSDTNKIEQEDPDEQGRHRKKPFFERKIIKGAMIGLAAMKGLLLPALSGLSFVTGKAIVFSLAAVVLSVVVAWPSSRYADRRIYNNEPYPYETRR